MVDSFDRHRILRASRLVREVAAALEGPSGARHEARTAAELARALSAELETFGRDALDVDLDRLVAIRNLSRNLDDRARKLRADLAAVIVEVMDNRPELMEPEASSRDPTDTQTGLVALDLVRDLASDFQPRAEPADGADASVVGHRRQRLYFRPGDPGHEAVPKKYRVEFPDSESAEIAGYRYRPA